MAAPSDGMSAHALSKRRRNRRQVFWTAALATLVVLGMTAYDLKFRDYSATHRPETFYHAINSDAARIRAPDDNSELTVWQGALVPHADGTVTLAPPAPVTPVTFAQRQVDLLFRLDSLDEAGAPAAARHIGKTLRAWDGMGNLVMDAILDVSRLNAAALPALGRLMDVFHDDSKGQYRLSLRLDPLASGHLLDGLEATARRAFLGRIHYLDIAVTANTAAQAIAAADTLGHDFSVTVPAGTDLAHFASEATAKAKHFRYFIRAVPEDTPPPATGE